MVYEVPNSKRWTWNSNNDAGEKAAVSNKIKELVFEYCTEPENIKKSKIQSEMEERCATDDLDEFGPADDVEASH